MIDHYLAGQFSPVSSTYCKAIAFEDQGNGRGEIGIRYADGQEWWYGPYSADEAVAFFNAGSKGQWAWDYIRVRGTRHQHKRSAKRG